MAAAFWLLTGRLAAAGPEDDFWSAPVLTGTTQEISGTMLGATSTPELAGFEREQVDGFWREGIFADLWWRFVMPFDGLLEAQLEGIDPRDQPLWRLELRTGDFPTGPLAASSEGIIPLFGSAQSGQRLHVRVRVPQARLNGLHGPDFRLVLRVWPLPANRTLETAAPLEGPQIDQVMDFLGTGPVWFRWVAPRTEWVRLSQSPWETSLAVAPARPLGGDPAWPDFFHTPGVTFLAEAGQAYWLGFRAGLAVVGSVRISLRPVLPEPGTEATNDARDRATILTGSRWTLTGDTTFATGDPAFAQELFAATRETAGGRDLWWQWVAPAEGDLVIGREEPYSEAVLWIRRQGGTWERWRSDFPRTRVVAGEVLEFAADGERRMLGPGPLWDVAPGPFTFSGRFLPRPTNDRWAAAETLTGAEVSWEVPDDGSVAEPGSPVDAGRWWRWVAPRDGVVWCRFMGHEPAWFLPNARWFSGDSLDALVPVPPDWSLFFSTPHLASVKSGATYWLWLPKTFAGRVELRLLSPAANTAPESARLLTGIFNEVEQENLSTLGQAAHWFRWTAPATGTFTCRTVGAGWATDGSSLPTMFTELDLFRENDLGDLRWGTGVRSYLRGDQTRSWWAMAVTAGETVWIRATLDGSAGFLGYPWLGRHRFETELVPFRLMPSDSAATLTEGSSHRFRLEAMEGHQTNSIVRILGTDALGSPSEVLGTALPFEAEFHVPVPEWWSEFWQAPGWNTYVALELGTGRYVMAASPRLPVVPPIPWGDSFSAPIQLGSWDSGWSLRHLDNSGPDPGSPADLAPGIWLAWRSLLGGPVHLSLTGSNLVATIFQGTNLSELRKLAGMETGPAHVITNALTLDAGTELRIHVSGPKQSGPRGFTLRAAEPAPPLIPQLRAGDTWEFHFAPPPGATPSPRVEFFADEALVATVAAPPWRWVWTNVPAGLHLLGARMIGGAGDVVEFPARWFGVSVTNDTFARRATVTGDSLPGGWSQWTAPASGLLELPGQSGRPVFLVTAGTLGPSVSYLGEPVWRQFALYPVQAGQTYAFSLDPLRAQPLPFRLRRQTPADWAEGAIPLKGNEPELLMPSLPGSLEEDERGLAAACSEIVQSLWWRWRAPTNGWLSFIPGPELEATCHTFEPGIRSNRLDEESTSGHRRWLVDAGRTIDLRLLLPPVAPGAVLGRLQFEPQGMLKSLRHLEDGAAEVVWYPLSSRDTWLGSVASLDSERPDWRRIIRLADEEFLEEPETLVLTNRIRLPAGESARFFRIEAEEPEIDDDDDD